MERMHAKILGRFTHALLFLSTWIDITRQDKTFFELEISHPLVYMGMCLSQPISKMTVDTLNMIRVETSV